MPVNEEGNNKYRQLEERTYIFARDCRSFVKILPKTTGNFEDGKQLVRASGSQAANYIEANESLSKKDFAHRIKICRKEAKESFLWLRLCEVKDETQEKERERLINETKELRNIFSAILDKST